MTDIDVLVDLEGVSVDIYRESKGAEDNYGDRAPTWTLQASERAIIQPRRARPYQSLAGRFADADYLGLFTSDSDVQANDYILYGSTKYAVLHVDTVTLQGSTLHLEAMLKLMEEGT